MSLWLDQPNTYKHSGFINIPEGDHRVRICKVEVERFSNKRKCFTNFTRCFKIFIEVINSLLMVKAIRDETLS